MKKFVLSLFVWLIWLVSFSYWVDFSIVWRSTSSSTFSKTVNSSDLICFKATVTNRDVTVIFNNDWVNHTVPWGSMLCVYWITSFTFNYVNANLEYYTYTWLNLWWSSCPECPTCPDCPTCEDQYTSLECQQEYSLMPIDSCNTQYCVLNDLCPSSSWGDMSWDLQYSNLFINNILHPWTQNIFVNIPDYITWDYNLTGDNFTIDVWSWYDMEYMNSIIKINSYRPDSEDFTNIFVSWLTLIFPYIFIALLIVFIRKLLKRIFK